jgi:hypothetical protein
MRSAFAAAALIAAASAFVPGTIQQQAVQVDADDIGGVVTGTSGPEAGVWVIAETNDLPTKFVRIVVTDDRGRYLLPDLPRANYSVWVRGYGLIDSPKSQSAPGRNVNLRAVAAPNAKAAAGEWRVESGGWRVSARRSRFPAPTHNVTLSVETG